MSELKNVDVAVVGGGPVGCYVSREIAVRGYRVVVFEKNKEIGVPLKCAGLVSERVFDFYKGSKEEIIQNRVKGAHVHSPSGDVLTIGGDKTRAYVINRVNFDKKMAEKSCDAGVEIFLKNKVFSVRKRKNEVDVYSGASTNPQHVRCKLLIGADGPHSMVRETFGMPPPSEMLKGIGAEVSNVNLNPDFVEIFLGGKIAPGFFAWIIPTDTDGDRGRIGLCVPSDASFSLKHYFSAFYNHQNVKPFLKQAKIVSKTGGVIPFGFLRKTYDSNVMIVGDAAAQVKPTSGGGLFTGLLSGKHCLAVSAESLEENDFTRGKLRRYQERWQRDIGREIRIGMRMRKIFKNLNDKQLDMYLGKMQDSEFIEIINKHGDIDFPSKLMKPLLRKPSVLLLIFERLFSRRKS